MITKLPIHLEGLSKADLEKMCVSCGLCCQPAIPIAKGVNALIPELKCKYLTKKAGGEPGETCCSVYETRFEKAGAWCLPLPQAIEKGIFPELCPYVVDMKGYLGKTVLDDHTYSLVRPQIKKAVLSKGIPDWMAEEDWNSFVSEDK